MVPNASVALEFLGILHAATAQAHPHPPARPRARAPRSRTSSAELSRSLAGRPDLRARRAMTSLRLGFERPSETNLKAYAVKLRLGSRPFNHGFMPGGSRPEPVKALRLYEKTAVIGHGKDTYARAQQLLLDWQMHEGSDKTGIWTDGKALVTYAQLAPGLWVLNPCRTLPSPGAETGDRRSCHVCYATTRGHLIAGCEQMSVRYCDDTTCLFEVSSGSRGSGWLGRAVFPFIQRSQRHFFEEQVSMMARQCRGAK